MRTRPSARYGQLTDSNYLADTSAGPQDLSTEIQSPAFTGLCGIFLGRSPQGHRAQGRPSVNQLRLASDRRRPVST